MQIASNLSKISNVTFANQNPLRFGQRPTSHGNGGLIQNQIVQVNDLIKQM